MTNANSQTNDGTHSQGESYSRGGTNTKELRQAIVRDFAKLYVKEFTTDWEQQRILRALELELMDLPNTQALIDEQTRLARIDQANADYWAYHYVFQDDIDFIEQAQNILSTTLAALERST